MNAKFELLISTCGARESGKNLPGNAKQKLSSQNIIFDHFSSNNVLKKMINLSEINPVSDMSDLEYPLENLEDPFEVCHY